MRSIKRTKSRGEKELALSNKPLQLTLRGGREQIQRREGGWGPALNGGGVIWGAILGREGGEAGTG